MPRSDGHGRSRNYRIERELARDEFETPDGETIAVEYAGSECSVSEVYCANCQTWTEVRGVTGKLRWLAHHEMGDCKVGA